MTSLLSLREGFPLIPLHCHLQEQYVSSCRMLCSCSLAQLCLTLCILMDCSISSFPVLCYLLEFAQTHDHWVGDAIQPSHSLSPFSFALNLSHHQGLFQWISSLHHVVEVLELQLQHHICPSSEYPGLISFGINWLGLLTVQGTLKSLLQPHNLKASFLQYHRFSALSLLYGPSLISIHDCWKNCRFDYMDFCFQSDVSAF